ncbi:CheB methylesterase domain-containing protein [Sulfuricurvum sp.]|uniref:CheB methylesterase domain-containing protein n=1 Tax=Sulfuricurvum sp. TaxID=2025608 RepID=UPI0026274C40|nr:CheB methylesterase domain-containing protein [Sulfuricurvum sp.]MDD2780733.1 CheB methylesterase domain-containing protein [Sulfuricurvum sp.]
MNKERVILIGSSTGGPGHIDKIIKALKKDFTGSIVIAQHMSPHFIESFARQIGTITHLSVSVVMDGMILQPSSIYVCSGDCRLIQSNHRIVFEHNTAHDTIYTPDIDTLFLSVSQLPSLKRMGIILTGIGDDGSRGALALFNSGGECMFESEESAIVYGMPRRALELVPDAKVGSLDQIIEAICHFEEL